MRRALILALFLSACTLASHKPAEPPQADAESPGGLATEQIAVSPLDGPGATAEQTVAGNLTPAAAASAAMADTIPVQVAGANVVHPKPRPGDASPPDAAATTAEKPAETPPAPPPEPPKSQMQLLCEGAAGNWVMSPDSGAYLCQKPTHDGAKACHKKSDCRGECLAQSGTCSPVAPLVGCNDVLDNQGRQVTLCLD